MEVFFILSHRINCVTSISSCVPIFVNISDRKQMFPANFLNADSIFGSQWAAIFVPRDIGLRWSVDDADQLQFYAFWAFLNVRLFSSNFWRVCKKYGKKL